MFEPKPGVAGGGEEEEVSPELSDVVFSCVEDGKTVFEGCIIFIKLEILLSSSNIFITSDIFIMFMIMLIWSAVSFVQYFLMAHSISSLGLSVLSQKNWDLKKSMVRYSSYNRTSILMVCCSRLSRKGITAFII